MSAKENLVERAREGKISAFRCVECGDMSLSTVVFCRGCGSSGFEDVILEGRGRIATYTIITVPPAGFEDLVPYAWAVMAIDGTELRISGFMAGISAPADLPVGTPARVTGFNKRGLILERD